jgi:photosystem II stability/assembly factor-like uncharacterized protein
LCQPSDCQLRAWPTASCRSREPLIFCVNGPPVAPTTDDGDSATLTGIAMCSLRLAAGLVLVVLAIQPACLVAAPPDADAPYAWRNVRIVGGGFVTGIITHPGAKGLMYARTDVGGAYRWDEAADLWLPITDWISGPDWSFTGIESLAVDASNPDRVYLAAGTYTNDWSPTNGAIFRSDDRGRSWRRTDMPFKMGGNEDGRANGERLAVDPNRADTLFFGSRLAGLWKSDDGAASWSRVAGFPDVATSKATLSSNSEWARMVGIVCVLFDARSGRPGKASTTLYAAVSVPTDSIFRSADGGVSWQAVPGQPTGWKPHHIALDADGSLYVTYGNRPGPNDVTDGAVWKLDTGKGRWTDVTPLKPSEGDKFGYSGLALDARRPGTVMVSTLDRWSRVDEIFRSADGGKTWNGIRARSRRDPSAAPWVTWGKDQVEIGHWIGDLEIDPFDSDHVLYVTGWGIWSSRDCTAADRDGATHWAFASRGIEECVVNDVISPPAGASVLSVVWDIDGFRHDELDRSPARGFFTPQMGRNTDIDFAQARPDVMVRVYGAREKSTGGAVSRDGGATWRGFTTSAVAGKGDGTVAVSADGETFVWTPEGAEAHGSRDGGATWTKCQGLPAKARVIADRSDAKRFYAFDPETGKLYVSSDGATSFTATAAMLHKAGGYLAAAPDQAGHLWLASDLGLFRSTDRGASFTKLARPQEASRIGFGKSAPDRDEPAAYIVGRLDGVYGFYRSDDGGVSWVRINDDRHQFGTINAITGDPRIYGRVYLGSANRGVLYGDPVVTKGQGR